MLDDVAHQLALFRQLGKGQIQTPGVQVENRILSELITQLYCLLYDCFKSAYVVALYFWLLSCAFLVLRLIIVDRDFHMHFHVLYNVYDY